MPHLPPRTKPDASCPRSIFRMEGELHVAAGRWGLIVAISLVGIIFSAVTGCSSKYAFLSPAVSHPDLTPDQAALIYLGNPSSKIVDLAPVDSHPELYPDQIDRFGRVKPSDATLQTLRQMNLTDSRLSNLQKLNRLQEEINHRPDLSLLAAFSELGYCEGVIQEKTNPEWAARIYLAVLSASSSYLFDENFHRGRNPLSTEYRETVGYYNKSSERFLRLLHHYQEGNDDLPIAPGNDISLTIDEGRRWTIHCRMGGEKTPDDLFLQNLTHPGMDSGWRPEEIGKLEFSSDYKVKGLDNHYCREGLGVPVIVERKRIGRGEEIYYPERMTVPMTLLLRPVHHSDGDGTSFLLEFYDPLTRRDVTFGRETFPLAADLTTPLACNFVDPDVVNLGTLGLIKPESFFQSSTEKGHFKRSLAGFYLTAPYDPEKIPVIMVHGHWSSPMTWLAMLGAFQNEPDLWDRYQFWFWCYPTGLPWWVSAACLRSDLAELRHRLDPTESNPRFDEMTLVGYSMGGLIARLQVCESGDDVWNLVSDESFDLAATKMSKEDEEMFRKIFFFHPNRSIRRVVTIAVPFKGSDSVNSVTQWLSEKLIAEPERFTKLAELMNSTRIQRDKSLLNAKNSIQSMSPDSPFFEILDRLKTPDDVVFNNIIGMKETGILFKKKDGDKIVRYESSHLEEAESEIEVDAFHTLVHTDPVSIRETIRILREHSIQMAKREETIDFTASVTDKDSQKR